MSEILFKRDATFDKCPKCKAIGKLRRSRAQSFFEKVVKKLGIFNFYRCRDCGWRGKRLNFDFTKTSLKTIIIYLALMFITAIIVKFIIQKIAMK